MPELSLRYRGDRDGGVPNMFVMVRVMPGFGLRRRPEARRRAETCAWEVRR